MQQVQGIGTAWQPAAADEDVETATNRGAWIEALMARTNVGRRRLLRTTWRRVSYIGGLRGRSLVGIGAASLLAGFCEALLIFLVIRIALVMSAGGGVVELPRLVGAGFELPVAFGAAGVVLAVLLALNYASAAQTARLSTRAVDSARRKTMDAFLSARYDLQAVERPSRLQELLSAHVNRIGTAALTLASGLSAALSFSAFVFSALFISPYSAVIIALATLLFGVVLLPFTKLTRRRSARQAGLNTAYSAGVNQVVTSAKETRVFGVSDVVRDRLAQQSRETAAAGYQTRLLSRMTPAVYQTVALLVLLICLAAAYALDLGGVGDLSAVVVLLVRAISYGQQVNTAIQQAGEAAPYLTGVLAKEEEFRDAPATPGQDVTPTISDLAFFDVSYHYATGEPVLRDLTFQVRRGQKVGIVGPSGSGKSTLVQLLLRLREPTGGRILLNGVDVRSYDYGSWFRRVSLVPQDNVLLPATIADNIRFFRPGLSDEAVVAAARAAHLHEVIAGLPRGYETMVGAGHQELSGGQRQRLGLARAFVDKPDVIVLDEPTSALDMDSEQLVQETLQSLGDDVTLFIVAHRLSTLNDCDVVMVLEDGRLVASGTHDHLLAENGFYRRAVALSVLPSS